MTAKDLKQIASILPDGDHNAGERSYKLTTLLNMALPPITGKTAAIERETPLFGGEGQSEQTDLFAQDGDK